LDASGGSVFLNLLGAAKGALIRAAASTQPLGLDRMTTRLSEYFSLQDATVWRAGLLLALPALSFVRPVGSGANGAVFEAYDTGLARTVAVKFWNKHIDDPSSRALAEAKKLAALSHPLLVTVHQFGTLDGTPYAVMEYVPGTTLRNWLAVTDSMRARCAAWFLISKALRFIYQQGHLHGDPHPGNILMREDASHHCAVYLPHHLAVKRVGLKLADTGTSRVWARQSRFREREARLLLGTAKQIFSGHEVPIVKTARGGGRLTCILDSYDYFAHIAGTYSELSPEVIEGFRLQAQKHDPS
jgi:serine/threonine protein kinase